MTDVVQCLMKCTERRSEHSCTTAAARSHASESSCVVEFSHQAIETTVILVGLLERMRLTPQQHRRGETAQPEAKRGGRIAHDVAARDAQGAHPTQVALWLCGFVTRSCS